MAEFRFQHAAEDSHLPRSRRQIKALDSLAALQRRDRSFVLNETVEQYLSLSDYHTGLIKEGLRQAKAGRLIPHEQVVKAWKSEKGYCSENYPDKGMEHHCLPCRTSTGPP